MDVGRPPLPHLIDGLLGGHQVERDSGCDNRDQSWWGDESEREDVETDNGQSHGALVVGTLPNYRHLPLSQDNDHIVCQELRPNSNAGATTNERVGSSSLATDVRQRLGRGEAVKRTVAANNRSSRLRQSPRRAKGSGREGGSDPNGQLAATSAQSPHNKGPGGPASSGLRRQVSHIISQCPEYSALEPGVRENIWDKVSKEHPNAASRVDMRRYDVRMATFNDNPLNWCLRTPTPERLARVGLYYLGVEDGVRCFSCGVELDEWDEEGTPEPLLRHFLARPHCSFLQQDFHDQLPRLREQSAQQSKYANTSQRLHSFAQWPYSDVVTSYQLASVGFYYTGEGAMVTCFSCGLVIKEWKRGDVPLLVHCRRNPDCRFISSIIKKGTPSSAQAQAPVPVLKTLTTADSGAATNRPNFSDQETRLKSFKKLSPLFPISRQNLAEAGLYLLRLPDVMKCHCCSAVLQAWVDGDVAVEKHRAANPECPFLAEKFPCKLDHSVSLDFDPSNLPAAQFDENELEMMARQQSVSPPTAHTHSPFLHLQPPSLPTPDSLHMAGLSLSDIPSHPHTLPSSHTPNSYSGVPAHHTSLADSQPPSLPTLTASLSSPTGEPQPMSLSATLTHTHPPSHNASSGYHSNTHTLALSSGVPHTHPYSGTDTPLSGYHSSSRQSMEYRTDTIPLTSSGFNLSSHPPSSNTPFSPLSTTEVGGKSVSLPPSYSQAPHPAQTMPSTATQPSSLPSGAECVVCMDRPLEMVFVPCGHICVCEICSSQITRCPICRTRTQMAVKVYFPF